MAVTPERGLTGSDGTEPLGYLIFARGPLDAVAERMPRRPADVGPRVPLLLRPGAEVMSAALRDMAQRTASASAGTLRDFIAALGDLGLADETTVYPLLSLLALDGLVGPVVAGAFEGASVFAVSTREPVPFFRACVRPAGPAVAASFTCGTLFPSAPELDGIFRARPVQRCLASRDAHEEVIAEMPARDQLDRINALRYHSSAFEFHAYNRLPVVAAGRLAALGAPATKLARAVLTAGGGREPLARLLSQTAADALTLPFEAGDRLEAALGVLFDELVVAWVKAGGTTGTMGIGGRKGRSSDRWLAGLKRTLAARHPLPPGLALIEDPWALQETLDRWRSLLERGKA